MKQIMRYMVIPYLPGFHQKAQDSEEKERSLEFLKEELQQIVGTYTESKNFGFVIPDDKKFAGDIFIPKAASNGAVEGHKVVVKLTTYPEGRMSAEGEVIQILGHKNDPGVDILSVIHKHGLPRSFRKRYYSRQMKHLIRLMKVKLKTDAIYGMKSL